MFAIRQATELYRVFLLESPVFINAFDAVGILDIFQINVFKQSKCNSEIAVAGEHGNFPGNPKAGSAFYQFVLLAVKLLKFGNNQRLAGC